MSLKPSQTWAGQFTVLDATGALANADSLPTGTLIVDGANNGATVTIANVSTGVYSFSVTVPAGATAGQFAQIRIAATISTIASGGIVADALIDTVRVSDLNDIAVSDITGVTIESSLTLAHILKILLAFVGGTTAGGNTTSIQFKSQDGNTNRISMTVDSDGDRSAVTVNGA